MRAPPERGRAACRGVAAAGLAVALAAPASAHYLRLQDELVAPRTFTVGIALTGRPFAYREDGVVRGFEVAMAKRVADSHGLELRIVQVPRDSLAATLRRGEVDAVNSLALPPGEGDGELVPYLVVGDHVMVLRGNPFRVSRYEDLSGRTVSATAGSSAEVFAREVNDRLRAQGRAEMHIHSFPNQRDTHFPVSMGHAAAYFIRTVSAVGISRDPESRTRLVEGLFRPVREVGFAVPAQRENVVHAIEHAIAATVATGSYERLRVEYGLPESISPFR